MNQIAKAQDNVPATTGAVTPMQLLQVAMDQGADLDRLEKLMDLQQRWEQGEAKKAYITAMADFRSRAPEISRTRTAHNSTYAGLAETLQAIKPLLSECGLSHSWKTEQRENAITVTCCVTHIAGHTECTSLSASPDTSGSKNSIQAIGSTVSYLERYTLYAVLGLASRDMDDDAKGAEPPALITEKQAADLEALISEVGADRPGFLKYLKIAAIEDLPAKAYPTAVKALEARRAKGK